MDKSESVSLELVNAGYKMIVNNPIDVRCKVCFKNLSSGREFFYCSKTQLFWCYSCRGEEWGDVFKNRASQFTTCGFEDEHTHFHIVMVEILKKEVVMNE